MKSSGFLDVQIGQVEERRSFVLFLILMSCYVLLLVVRPRAPIVASLLHSHYLKPFHLLDFGPLGNSDQGLGLRLHPWHRGTLQATRMRFGQGGRDIYIYI